MNNEVNTSDSGKTLGVLSIVFGAVGFLFCPIGFGLAGMICGIVGASIGQDKTLPTIGIVLSVLSIPIGMALGFLAFSAVS